MTRKKQAPQPPQAPQPKPKQARKRETQAPKISPTKCAHNETPGLFQAWGGDLNPRYFRCPQCGAVQASKSVSARARVRFTRTPEAASQPLAAPWWPAGQEDK